jgi:hypothetical protein
MNPYNTAEKNTSRNERATRSEAAANRGMAQRDPQAAARAEIIRKLGG